MGDTTGDQNLQNLGEYLYDTELNAFYAYYFNENPANGTFPANFSTADGPRTMITNVSDNGGSMTTFFGLRRPRSWASRSCRSTDRLLPRRPPADDRRQ